MLHSGSACGVPAKALPMIVVTTSGENRCHYCVVAHGAILRILSKRPLLADQLANNYRKADIDAREPNHGDASAAASERSDDRV